MKKSFYLQLFIFTVIVVLMGNFNVYSQDFSNNTNPIYKTKGQLPLQDLDALATTITHSVDPDSVEPLTSIACSEPVTNITSDNQYWRSFVLADFGITNDFNVTMVDIGIETAVGPIGGVQPMTVNLYTTDLTFPNGTLTLIGTLDLSVPDQALTHFQIPVTGTAPAGSELVVEISIPADIGNGNQFFLGANSLGQTADSWISTVGCGINTPVTTAALGFPDAMWVMSVTGDATIFQLTVSIDDGWNMVSIPGLHPVDQNVDTWWPGKDPATNVFKYSGTYTVVTTVIPGEGYWMKNLGAQVYNTGDEWPAGGIEIVSHDPISAAAGWNMIGGYEDTVSTSLLITNPPGLISGAVWQYDGFVPATELIPGYGYWIKLLSAGQIIIPETLAKGVKPVEYFKDDWGKIVLTDATGKYYTLYAVKGDSPNGGASVDLNEYELPPLPPAGMFDIRYSSGRIAEDINSATKTIEMSGVTYPLTVRVENMDIRLQYETGKNVNVNLKSGEDVVISDAKVQKLMVTGELIPAVYALEQNYPNPFNPSTVIEFSLPENVGNIKLSIYNTLGEKVAELVNTALTAGKYQYQWNAQNVATGMYIYELRTDKFVSVKKMILMK